MSLNGLVFAITGTLSVGRSEFEQLITSNGGTVAKSVTNKCTHLISSETGTKKCQDAEAKGVEIVDEDWVRNKIEGKDEDDDEDEDDEDDEDEDEDEEEEYEEEDKGKALEGMCFCISGKLMVERSEFERYITDNGGTFAQSITKKVTHLINSESDSKKCQEATEKGIPIVSENFVRQLVFAETSKKLEEARKGDYVTEMLDLGADDEGHADCSKKSVGLKITPSEWGNNPDLIQGQIYYIVSYHEVGNEQRVIVKSINPNDDKTFDIDGDVLHDDFQTLAPKAALKLWDKFQNRKITEGIWEGTADIEFMREINELIDNFARQEPPDYHPGTNNIVRDLVHPSLFPLLSDPSKRDTSKTNYWGRPYEASRFQWLPAEVSIDDDGNPTFISDINNLDRSKYPEIYIGLQKVFKNLLPGFEKVWQYARSISFVEEQDEWDDCNSNKIAKLKKFNGQTLQAIVKIADYEFKPGDTFEGVWHYEGMAHENIVMTGLFYPQADDELEGGLEFKRIFHDNEAGQIFMGVNQERPNWLNDMIEMGFKPLGKTTTDLGKYLVFPNCHAHRVMKMVNNTTRILRRRIVVFFIVDPKRKIPSSLKYPPLPRKITMEQALADRLELMQERKQAKQDLNPRVIELCEH